MNRLLTRSGALVGAAAIVLTSFLVATPAQAAPVGTLVVSVVDQYGRPVTGLLQVFDSAGATVMDPSPQTAASTYTKALPPGGYEMVSIGGWSGLICAGVTPCNSIYSAPGSGTYTPVVAIADGATTNYTIVAPVPSISGASPVGSVLSLGLPQGFKDLQAAYATIAAGFDLTPTVQWVRGATDIPGATGKTYTTTPADGGQPVTARLTPSAIGTLIFAQLGQSASSAFTTNAVPVQPYVPPATTIKTKVPKNVTAGERVSVKVTVTSPGGVPTGIIRLTVGKFTTQKSLQNGSVFVTLSSLSVGKQKIKTSYLGDPLFAASKAKTVKVTVKKKK